MKILIINLIRFGDIIQTLSVVDALAEYYPQAEIHFLVDRSLSFFPRHHPAVAKTILFDEKVHADLFQNVIPGKPLAPAPAALIAELQSSAYDIAINYQHGKIGPVIMRYLSVPDKRGSCQTIAGDILLADAATEFLFLTAKHRRNNNLNLVDHYCRIAGIPVQWNRGNLILSSAEEAAADSFLAARGITKETPFMCVQPGASKPYRQWPVDYFMQLIEYIAGAFPATTIIILGSAAEAACAKKIAAVSSRCLSLAGETDFSTLTALLRRTQLLITNETGTMHLAAYCGSPVIAVGMSEGSAAETAPRAVAPVVFMQPVLACHPCSRPHECTSQFSCQRMIPPDVVFSLAAHLLSGRSITQFRITTEQSIMYYQQSVKGRPWYGPLFPRECHGDPHAMVTEIIRTVLPYAWDMLHGTIHETANISTEIYEVFASSWRLTPHTWGMLWSFFEKDAAAIQERIDCGRVVVAAYQAAITTGDARTRMHCCQAVESFDTACAEIVTELPAFSFFADYYDLQMRMHAAAGHTAAVLIPKNIQVLENMHVLLATMRTLISQVCHKGRMSASPAAACVRGCENISSLADAL